MGFFDDLVYKAQEAGEFIYTNVKTGIDEAHAEEISGAKGNPRRSKADREAAANAELLGNTTELAESAASKGDIPPAYDQLKRPSKYNISGSTDKVEIFQENGVSPRSIANKWSLFRYRGTPMQGISTKDGIPSDGYTKAQVFRIGNSGSPKNPSAKTIIEETGKLTGSPGYQYRYEDFIYTKYYGKIPNNQLLTLRRFAFPVTDNIIRPVQFNADGKPFKNLQPALAQAVTFMGEKPGNNMKEILKFSVGFKWKTATSELQTINSQPRDRGKVGGFIDSMPFSQNIQGGLAGESASQTKIRKEQGAGYDPVKQTYPNHEFSPLNIIKSVEMREAGLNFSQEFSLKFQYDLKGIPGVSPKLAFLDVLANLLVLTYNEAPFWGGAVRYTGGGKKGKPFGDLKKLQSGDIKGFMGSVVKDLSKSITKGVKDIMKGGDSKILNNILGGAMMDLLGGPQGGTVAAAFLTGDPTGSWHLTVGNPLNPIAVIGNLACTSTEFEFDGPLGYEDFPTSLAITIKLKPAMPRDKGAIESMFNAGRGRLYLTEDGVLDPGVTYDVDAYGKVQGDKNGNLARAASKFANG